MKKFWHSFLIGWVGCHWFRYDKKSKLRTHQIYDIINHFFGWFFFLGFLLVSSGILEMQPISDDLVNLFEFIIRTIFTIVCISCVDSFVYLCCEDRQFVKEIKMEIIEKEKEDEVVNVNYEIK